jgi:hypothetical protein
LFSSDSLENAETGRFSPAPLNLLANMPTREKYFRRLLFMRKIKIEKTKKGYPALWERGGGYTNTGVATIIAGKGGQPKRAIYIRQRGPLANDDHALIPVEVGDYEGGRCNASY